MVSYITSADVAEMAPFLGGLMADGILKYGPKLRRGVLLGMVFGVPSFFLWGITYDPYNVPKLALLTMCTGAVGATYLVEGAFGRNLLTRFRPLVLPISFVAVPLALSWWMSPYRGWSLLGEYTRYEGLIPYLVIAVAGVFIADTFKDRPLNLAWAWILAGATVGSYALIQALGLDPIDNPITIYVVSTVGHGNFVGGFLAIVLPVATATWIGALPGHRVARVCTIIIATGVLVSFSQGGQLGAFVGVSLTIGVLIQKRFPRGPVIGISVVAAVSAITIGYVLYCFLVPDGVFVSGTALARAHWWRAAIEMASDSPLVGHGPNAFAIESPTYRTPFDAIAHRSSYSDGPHSVPLSMLANSGLLGLVGYLSTFAWALIRAKLRYPGSALRAGFAGGIAAYFVQALVSFDEVLLALALWISLAGVAASVAASDPSSMDVKKQKKRPVGIALFIAAALVLMSSFGWSLMFLISDARVLAGAQAFGRSEVGEGRILLQEAISFNDQPAYRRVLGDGLGAAAMDRMEAGRSLLNEMRGAFSYIDELPSLHGILGKAHWLHLWSVYDLESDAEAVTLLQRAISIDPYNPQIRVQIAEAFLHLNRPQDAIATLREAISVTDQNPAAGIPQPAMWALLSVAEDERGNRKLAELYLARALAQAREIGVEDSDCHVLLARVRVANDQAGRVGLGLSLFCSAVTRKLSLGNEDVL